MSPNNALLITETLPWNFITSANERLKRKQTKAHSKVKGIFHWNCKNLDSKQHVSEKI